METLSEKILGAQVGNFSDNVITSYSIHYTKLYEGMCTMKAAKSSVWDLYNGAKQYVVPLFQRPYVWSRPQWEQLWSDITEQYTLKSGSPHEKIPDRFLGSIVVVREYEKNLDKYTIIDGP